MRGAPVFSFFKRKRKPKLVAREGRKRKKSAVNGNQRSCQKREGEELNAATAGGREVTNPEGGC